MILYSSLVNLGRVRSTFLSFFPIFIRASLHPSICLLKRRAKHGSTQPPRRPGMGIKNREDAGSETSFLLWPSVGLQLSLISEKEKKRLTIYWKQQRQEQRPHSKRERKVSFIAVVRLRLSVRAPRSHFDNPPSLASFPSRWENGSFPGYLPQVYN